MTIALTVSFKLISF